MNPNDKRNPDNIKFGPGEATPDQVKQVQELALKIAQLLENDITVKVGVSGLCTALIAAFSAWAKDDKDGELDMRRTVDDLWIALQSAITDGLLA